MKIENKHVYASCQQPRGTRCPQSFLVLCENRDSFLIGATYSFQSGTCDSCMQDLWPVTGIETSAASRHAYTMSLAYCSKDVLWSWLQRLTLWQA